MSRLRERAEKNCLNCGTEVHGRFCHNCGQENIEPKETVWHLVTHFFKDFTHFDGKFFSTLKYLITKPGFVSKEYMMGRRASYVNPVRMYIFTSAFFFLIFFSFTKINQSGVQSSITVAGKSIQQIESLDSLAFDEFTRELNKINGKSGLPMSKEEFKNYYDSVVKVSGIHLTSTRYRSKEHYDSLLRSGVKKHSWWQKKLIYQEIAINEKYKKNSTDTIAAIGNILLHSLPQLLFLLLPLFALILKLLYFRHRNYFYVDHGIFSIHFYIFSFITMLILYGLGKFNETLGWSIFKIIQVLLGFGILFYLYKAMRRFYMQGRAKTIFKFFILGLSLLVSFIGLFIIFIIFSFFKL